MIKGTVKQVLVVLGSRIIFIHCRWYYNMHSESSATQLTEYSSVSKAYL